MERIKAEPILLLLPTCKLGKSYLLSRTQFPILQMEEMTGIELHAFSASSLPALHFSKRNFGTASNSPHHTFREKLEVLPRG